MNFCKSLKIKDYFRGKNNLVNIVRNKFAFHYDKEKIKKELQNVDKDENLEMFLSEEGGQGNCLYAFSDLIVHRAMLRHAEPSNIGVALNKLMDEIVKNVTRWFLDFGGEYLVIIAKKLNIDYPKTEILEILDPPSLRELRLPFFVKR